MKKISCKKLTACILCLVMSLSLLAGCGNEAQSDVSVDRHQSVSNMSADRPQSIDVCSNCVGTGECQRCLGNGDCFWCSGMQTARCSNCLGDGECLHCSGDGGSYEYAYGGDIKWRKCSYCSGNGTCKTCGGDGESACTYCYGSGTCSYCSGIGRCNVCGGSGQAEAKQPSQTYDSFDRIPEKEPAEPTKGAAFNEVPETPDDGSNMLKVTIDGAEHTFYLDTAAVKTDYKENFQYVSAYYKSFNPRGEVRYELYFAWDSNLEVGAHDVIADGYALDMGISLRETNTGREYHSSRKYTGKDAVVGTVEITHMSENWDTYEGTFQVELYEDISKKTPVKLENGIFHFTLGETHEKLS